MELHLKIMITYTVSLSFLTSFLIIFLTSHHAGNGMQMSSTLVTKYKPASCYDRPGSDNDKP